MKECFQIEQQDNVATLLQDVEAGEPLLIRGLDKESSLLSAASIRAGHKIATQQISAGHHVLKYGSPIGEASCLIQTGEWVHLHNCRSLYDPRSSSLDVNSGVRSETSYV